ncbi:Lipid A 3-O-deacylase (PagL) [Pseudooceanicola antarcticus]|uniref:Acyloxyacyl hydrolase n=1 Tax=Pseudooceanicola antarcticus TaxID=1247613 RepID=A0A285JNJ2_9RHOB|nr:acyloxyacyl hydrolase [Pseudooceanicola antarcticus]PJE30226.1 acyloxyacyl hydrolase [Pseudooceanicola antarcticus]SNY60896.1 Lipid A 3-O-deacylase (PagL) [Pseudooceanicola antarcticus]
MDGTLAVLFLLSGLTDMGLNHCGAEGCLAQAPAENRLAISGGQVLFQEDHISNEIYLKYDFGNSYGPFQPSFGLSVTDEGDAWVGMGASWTAELDQLYVQLSLMPGLYAQGDGPDLGHTVEFRSGIELGYEARNGWRYGLMYDHRSNAELSSLNPGLETLQFRVSVPLN